MDQESGEGGRNRTGSASSIASVGPVSSAAHDADCSSGTVDYPANIERMFETFHQSPSGDFKPTFYNPFEIKHRRRTTKAQFRVLETAFQENNKPNAGARRTLAAKLGMTPRAVQVWFQNRRAKCKTRQGEAGMESPLMACEELQQQSQPHQHSRCSSTTPTGTVNLGRRHSMPEMQPLNASQLPFKELHEAIFGRQGKSEPFARLAYAAAADQCESRTRKNSGCSNNFLNSFLNLGLTPEFGQQASMYDPMISGDTQGRLLRTGDLATPSISAPGSSPAMHSEDLFQLQHALRSGQAPNAAAVEAMAARLTSSLSPVELDMLLQNVVCCQKKDADFFAANGDLTSLLFPTGEGAAVNPMELLSCLPNGSEQYCFPEAYEEAFP